MQIAVFLLFILTLFWFFFQDRRKFTHMILIVGGFPLALFMPTLIIPISGGINVSGAFLLILFVLTLVVAIENFPIFIKVVQNSYLFFIFVTFWRFVFAIALASARASTRDCKPQSNVPFFQTYM